MKRLDLLTKLVVAVGLFFVVSCEKKDDTFIDLNGQTGIFLLQNNVTIDPSNSQNPIDSVGRIHNELLDRIAIIPGFDTMNINSYIYNTLSIELNLYNLSNDIPLNLADSIVEHIWLYSNNDDQDTVIEDLYIYNYISEDLALSLKDLFSVLDYNRGDVPIEQLIDSIKAKENQFILDNWNTNDQVIYLGTASVLRYSAYYWDNVIEDTTESHPFYQIYTNYLSEKDGLNSISSRKWNWKKFWRGMAIVGADALGYGLTAAIVLSNPATAALAPTYGTTIGAGCSAAVGAAWEIP